jgi:hypothetical protein
MPPFARFRLLAFFALVFAAGSASSADQPSACRYRLAGQLPLQYHGSSMSVTTGGQINRTAAVMLIDTGASSTFITRLGTDKRSMWLDNTLDAVAGVGGTSRLYRAPLRHFQIGPIISEPLNGSLLAIDEMGERPDFDAIVGVDFLLEMDLEIILADKQMKFYSPKNCEDTFLGYWDAKAIVVPMKPERGTKRPMIEILLNGVKMTALIDTGASTSSVTRAAAGRAGVTPASAGVRKAGQFSGIGSKRINVYNAAFKTFSVGEETINNPVLMMMEGEQKGFDVLLGTDFLRAHRVLLAASQKAVYLSYTGGKPFDDGKAVGWIEKDAQSGNSYAQFRMAMETVDSDNATAATAGRAWLTRAAAANNPLALHYLAREHARLDRRADSVSTYEQLVALDTYDLSTQIELFAARTKNGRAAEAKSGLKAALAQFRWPRWPAPIAEYYLGESKLDDVLRQSRKDSDVAQRRECETYRHAHALQDALGQVELATGLAVKAKDSCAKANGHNDEDDERGR